MATLLDSNAGSVLAGGESVGSFSKGWGLVMKSTGSLRHNVTEKGMAQCLGDAARDEMRARLVREGHVQTGLLTENLVVDVKGDTASIKAPRERQRWLASEVGRGEEWLGFNDTAGEAVQRALDEYAKNAITST